MTDEPRASRRVLPPWTWPALDRLEQRVDSLEGRLATVDTTLQQLNHDLRAQLDRLAEMTAAINHRTTSLDEIAHLARHLDERFNLVRDEVEIISALTLALQRQAERQGLVAAEAVPPA